jgi:DNA-binding MarR family transcriptional regulator
VDGIDQDNSSDTQRAVQAILQLVRFTQKPLWKWGRAQQVTLTQLQCLGILNEQREKASVLAKKLSISPSSLTRILERLESHGWVERTIDLHDRRRILVALTVHGGQVVEALNRRREGMLREIIAGMTPHDITQLANILEWFVTLAKEPQENGIHADWVQCVSDKIPDEIPHEGI